jgi:hypothetical protein
LIGGKRDFDNTHYYDDDLRDLVAEKYAVDIKDYGYDFVRVDDNS